MFTQGKPEGQKEWGAVRRGRATGHTEFRCAPKCCSNKTAHPSKSLFLVFILFCSLAVCSLCKCSPPSLLVQQTVPHRPGETTGCSSHHTGPSSPGKKGKNVDLIFNYWIVSILIILFFSFFSSQKSKSIFRTCINSKNRLSIKHTSSPSGSLHHGAAHSE